MLSALKKLPIRPRKWINFIKMMYAIKILIVATNLEE